MSHPKQDVLFLSRYILALLSSVASMLAIKGLFERFFGKLCIALFLPFILIQLVEVWVVYKCNPAIDTYWGIDCSTLLIYPDESKFIQVVTDELAVFLLGIVNLFLLWNCHMTHAHRHEKKYRNIKHVSREAFLSGHEEYLSAEEGESNTVSRVSHDSSFVSIIPFRRQISRSHPTSPESGACLSRLSSSRYRT